MFLLIAVFVFAACSDDDNSGTPVITGVTTTTPGADYFTETDRGTMIVIEGEHLGGARQVLINDQEVYLNPCYNTSTHIIVTIPAELTLTAENPELRGEIRVVTDHGEGAYAFHIKAPQQWITEVQVERVKQSDGSYLAMPGGSVTILGKNFYDLQRVYLTANADGSGQTYDLTGASVNKDFDEISATLPTTLPDEGLLIVECQTNSDSIAWVRSAFAEPTITTISDDMPVTGTTVTITGENFFKVSGLDICGEYMISANELQVSDDGTTITFTMKDSPTSGDSLSVVTASGKASVPF